MKKINFIQNELARLRDESDGGAMVEALMALPILTVLAFGMLEFGSMFWQREQIETGLRDAARYMARCRHESDTCEATARNLAYYGSVGALANPRVPNWEPGDSPITFQEASGQTQTVVKATTTHQLVNSPLFGFLGIDEITITSWHDQRVMGW